MLRPPRGILVDFGGTLVEEVSYDPRAGMEVLLGNLTFRPRSLRIDTIIERMERVTREVADRRDESGIETPWPALTRLIYDFFHLHFASPLTDLELMFWDASNVTRPMPGASAALRELSARGIPLGVVSNSSFCADVIRFELAKHDLAEPLAAIVASADYAVRKPNPLLFEIAAARIEVPPKDIWFVGDRIDTDVAGAKAAGMTSVLLAPPGTNDTGAADLVITSWADLLPHL